MSRTEFEPKFEHNNPQREHMNNFHGHMPGGIYRPGSSFTGAVWEEYGPLLDQDESSWPEKERRLLKVMRTKRAIQKDIDEMLEQEPQLLENWQTVEPISTFMSHEMREHVLRPLYLPLREKYSEEDLSS